MRRFLFPSFLALTFFWFGSAFAASLEVVVLKLENDDGDVHIALYNDPASFPDSDGMLNEVKVAISDGRAVAMFHDLTPGAYAVAVYHDANGNHEFDQGILGIPLEDFGFSSGARAFLGPPSFADAAFDVQLSGTRIEIPLND